MPRTGGNLRSRPARARRPPLFADLGGPEVRKHVQGGVRPPWYSPSDQGDRGHAPRPRRPGAHHKLRRRGLARVCLSPFDAPREDRRPRGHVVPRGLRIRQRERGAHGGPALPQVRALPQDASGGRCVPGLSHGGRPRVHRERGQVLPLHRMLEGVRRRRGRREDLQVLQEVQGRLLQAVLTGARPGSSGREGAIGTSCPGTSASFCRIRPCGLRSSCRGPS